MDAAAEAPPPPAPPPTPVPPPRRRWLRAIGWAIVGLIGLVAAIGLGIDTGPGHRLIVDRVAALRIPTGLRIRIGRIEGSIWHRAVLRDVRLYDLRGQFFAAPVIRLDWHPLAWVRNRLDIDRLAAPAVTLARAPILRKTGDQALLPGFDIRIGRLAVDRLTLGRAVTGTAATLRLAARADIRDRQARIGVDATSDRGDRLRLDLDAAPEGDRFHLAGAVSGPAGGVIDAALGRRGPFRATVGGAGGWRRWDGQAHATLAGRPLVDLALRARDGRYGLTGALAPAPFLAGKGQRLTAPSIRVTGDARLADRRLEGALALASPAIALRTHGAIDLARSRFAGLAIDARLIQPTALFPNMTGRDIALHVTLDGPFATTAFRYALTSPHIAFDATGFDQVRASGAGTWSRLPITLPIRLSAARVTGLGPEAGGILGNLVVAGTLKVDARTLVGSGLDLSSDKLKGKLGLRLDLVTGRYDIAVTGGLQRYLIPGLGIVDVDSELSVVPTVDGLRTIVTGKGRAAVRRFDNAFLRSLAGGLPTLTTGLIRDPDGTLRLNGLVLTAPSIRITGNGVRRRDGSFQFSGTGTQASYGRFAIDLDGMIDHPKIRLLFDRPVPALGLRGVTLDLDPVAQGFAFRAGGGSTLGPFAANGTILTPPGAAGTSITVAALDVTGTHGRGVLTTAGQAFAGTIDLSGGGIAGTLRFAPAGAIQRIDPHLGFADATLAGDAALRIARGRLDGSILLDPAGTIVDVALTAQGVQRGGIRLARFGASIRTRGDRGAIIARLSGARGRSFDLNGRLDLAPGRMALALRGEVDRKAIALDTPAVLNAEGDGWRLAPTRLAYAGGSATVSGRFGGTRTAIDAGLERMPLILLDLAYPGLGLGGTASGKLAFARDGGGLPTGRLDMNVRGLTRSSLVLSSPPIDLGIAGALTPGGLAVRAVAASGGRTIGRAQARIAPIAPGGDLLRRLGTAPLFAQLRYAGPADAIWRLAGIGTIDLSGSIAIGADIGGTLDAPAIRGTLRTDAARIESAVTGTVVDHIRAAGRFDGAQLRIEQLTGTAGAGSVSGSARFDLGLADGLAMDVTLAAREAQLINRDDIAATVTGPLRLRSSGSGGSISGEVVLDRSRYRLGAAAAAAQIPRLNVTERNGEDAPAAAARVPPWTLDLKARAPGRLMVRGLGLDSEWRASLTIRGAVDNPAIGGTATLVQGAYQFAGRRFDLERGTIRFSGEAPPDPILDITAGAALQGVNATIRVTGTGLRPTIGFESVPALPEDELLSRLLFGTSIANLSAPEALQLASAVGSLRSGGGGRGLNLDPINAVRRIARLDRLRILPADITTGQKTAIAAGKYIGRRFYVEVITDGAGYSATSTEFRITRWLSVLSTISTIGRQSANVRVSKDY